MMEMIFSGSENLSDVFINDPTYPSYNQDLDTFKQIGQNKGNFNADIDDYSDQYHSDDDFFTNNDTTKSYGADDDELLNCTDQLKFIMEMNKFFSPSQIVVPAVYCCICLIGLIGNGLVMFVIFGSKEMTKTVANIYIWNLAIADTLFLVSLPFTSTQRILLSWPFGAGMCKIVEAVKYLNYFASVFFLTAMSIDRYIAVVYVVTSSKWRTSRNTFFVCAAVWSISLILIIPLLIYTEVHTDTEGMCALVFNSQDDKNGLFPEEEYEEKEIDWIGTDYSDYDESKIGDCAKISYFDDYTNVEPLANGDTAESSNDLDFEGFIKDLVDEGKNDTEDMMTICKHPASKTFHIFLIFNFVVGFVVPFFIITICYILIVVRLLRPSETRTRSKQAERTRRKVTRMVVILVVTFFTCWLPFYIWHMIQIVGVKTYIGVCHNIRDFTFCLGYANSCLNPILYTFLGHNFRERLRKSVAISLRSFSFHTFTKSSHTISRADMGTHSKAKLEGSRSDNIYQPHRKTKKMLPLRRAKDDERIASKYSSTNDTGEKLLIVQKS